MAGQTIVILAVLAWLVVVDRFAGNLDRLLAGARPFRPGSGGNARLVIARRISLALLYGFVPVSILRLSGRDPAAFGIGLRNAGPALALGIAGAAILAPLVYLQRGAAANLARYPEIRSAIWTPCLVVRSAWSWAGYLLAYESFFRGVFLFSAAGALGAPAAVALNIAAYSLVHRRKGRREALGAVPFGLLLCFAALRTGSVLAPWLIHVGLAWSNEWLSLAAGPGLRFRRIAGDRP